jgi:EmrB/QacA subfamily drug resistance transporter
MITASFADGRERARALGIYTAVVMGGGSLGLVLGGVITEWVSWRWVLFVNVPIGIVVILAAPLFLPETERQPGHFDLIGALTSTAGMTSLVYGIIRAASDGWSNQVALAALAAAVVLLALFVVRESRARQPITPLRLFADRGRAGSYITRLLLVAGMFGMFFFLTQFVQDILHFSPLQAGIAFLPMTGALFAVSRLSPRLVSRFDPKLLMVVGMLPVVAGMTWLSRISVGTTYPSGVLGPMLLLGAGMGVVFVPLTMASLNGVHPEDSGAASSMVNVMQQVGGSLGLAILVTAYSTATRNAIQHPVAHLSRLAEQHHAIVHGMSSAFTLAAVFDILAFLIVLLVIRDRARPRADRAPQPTLAVQEAVEEAS